MIAGRGALRYAVGMALLYSLIESPGHPDLSALYRELGLEELRFGAMRKAIASLKRKAPDFVVGEFFYGWANNYAGVNLSNLDVFLYSLQKYAPTARVIVLAGKNDLPHVDKLAALFPLHAVLAQPVAAEAMREALQDR